MNLNNKSSITHIEPYHEGLEDGHDTQYHDIGVRGCMGSTDYPFIWQCGEYKKYVNPDDWIATDAEGKKYIISVGVVKLFGLDLKDVENNSQLPPTKVGGL